jgi:hypothetical protein
MGVLRSQCGGCLCATCNKEKCLCNSPVRCIQCAFGNYSRQILKCKFFEDVRLKEYKVIIKIPRMKR